MRFLISEKEFSDIMHLIEEQRTVDEEVSDALSRVCFGHVAFCSGSGYETAAVRLLEKITDDLGQWIQHWLYENDSKGFVWYDEQNNEHTVSSHAELYAFLKENAESRLNDKISSAPMTPAQFKTKMKKASHLKDLSARHERFDELMCRQLSAMGFEEGIDIFLDADKWYA